jgi:hypothetical protein
VAQYPFLVVALFQTQVLGLLITGILVTARQLLVKTFQQPIHYQAFTELP